MITDVPLDHSALVPVAFGLVALACVGIGHAGLRGGVVGCRLLWALTGLSALVVLALTLSPGGQSGRDAACTVQFALPTLTRVELLANVALFVPPVLFATLAARRPLLVMAAAVGASAAIEGLQAAVPAIGRACDTNDWLMNALGVLVGALLAQGTLATAGGARTGPARLPSDGSR
ncbi:VanZ family protein [Blastococcus tunisiensis]|uniref:VanZ like family protein n=1 Tax=Blastococcus tunisiensis TaxID=1798228 RepID=A0A1I2EF20_9ACTN|nr:VanZ family protein [Blastococcus sp. DSM 46838]SFE91263.1 VanZ like family protein [Blastococcus sp. DSM 46838]